MDSLPPHVLFQQEFSFTDPSQAEKRCSKCHERKPLSAFLKRSNRKVGVSSRCKQCLNEVRRKPASPPNPPIEQKECSRCHQIKPLSDFAKRKGRKIGAVSRCKQCHRETDPKRNTYVKGRYPEKSLEYRRNKTLLRYYGISLADYDVMLASQGGTCKVCHGPSLGKGRYHVDHDHVTGKIRGLLCHKCNVALGMVHDNVEHLKALIAYLEKELT